MRTVLLLSGLLVAALAIPQVSSAQATTVGNWRDYRAEVDLQLDVFASAGGFTSTHNRHYDWLDAGASQYVTIDLTAGVPYVIVGVCDNDCSDLDLSLFDDNGNLIDDDLAIDGVPMVFVTPAWSATYELEVRMYSCSVEPCLWGVGAFR